MSGTRPMFPEAFKREAVDRVRRLSAGAVARELGLHETVLRRIDHDQRRCLRSVL